VPFLLIGGHAVITLGHVRATFDYDFLSDESHRAALNAVFEDFGYTLLAANGPFVQWTPPPGLPPDDVMLGALGSVRHSSSIENWPTITSDQPSTSLSKKSDPEKSRAGPRRKLPPLAPARLNNRRTQVHSRHDRYL